MRQQWRSIAYVHWPVESGIVQGLLPPELEVDTFDGVAWVGLIPFRMVDIGLARGPAVPYFGTFPETNVRTYVRGSEGPGVWFHSLDITRLMPVLIARSTYRLPYAWAHMDVASRGNTRIYTAERRWPREGGAASHLAIDVGHELREATQLDHFLTARWRLYTMLRGRLAFARVEHPPWPLHSASVTAISDTLVTAAGYPAPAGDPFALYSPGVSVRVERPRFVSGRS